VHPPTPDGFASPTAPPQAVQPQAGGSLEDYFDRLDAAFASLDAGAAPAAGSGAPVPPPGEPVIVRNSDVMPVTPQQREPDTAPADAHPIDELSGWDPDLTGDPTRPATFDGPAPAESRFTRAEVPPPVPPVAFSPPAAAPASAGRPPAPAPAVRAEAAAPHVEAPAISVVLPSLAEAFATLLAVEQGHPVPPTRALRVDAIPDTLIDDIVRRVTERMSEREVKETVIEVAERLVREEIARIKSA
jgi:hypothetical protein